MYLLNVKTPQLIKQRRNYSHRGEGIFMGAGDFLK